MSYVPSIIYTIIIISLCIPRVYNYISTYNAQNKNRIKRQKNAYIRQRQREGDKENRQIQCLHSFESLIKQIYSKYRYLYTT